SPECPEVRGKRANDAYVPTFVHLIQSLYIASKHVRRLRTTLVDRHALEEGLGPKGFRQVLRHSLARIHRPPMEFVEPNLLRTGTVYDPAFAEVFRTLEFTDSYRPQSVAGMRPLRYRGRERQNIGRGITNAP